MPLRKYQATTNKDEQVVTTGDGHTLVKGTGNAGCTYCFLPPPADGGMYLLNNDVWYGPFYIASTGLVQIDAVSAQIYPSYEGQQWPPVDT